MPLLRSYYDVAPLGLLGCRPAGAIVIPPRWGYFYAAPPEL